MKRILYFFHFDIRNMRVLFFIPIISWIISIVLILFRINSYDKYFDAFLIVQGIYIPFGCWWIIFRLYAVYEDGAEETLLSYYQKYLWFDIARYVMVCVLGLVTLAGIIVWKFDSSVINLMLLFHFFLLILFYVLAGAITVIVLKALEVSIALVFLYTILEVITQGTFMPWPHIFQFELESGVIHQYKILWLCIMNLILAFLAGFLFKKSGNRKHNLI